MCHSRTPLLGASMALGLFTEERRYVQVVWRGSAAGDHVAAKHWPAVSRNRRACSERLQPAAGVVLQRVELSGDGGGRQHQLLLLLHHGRASLVCVDQPNCSENRWAVLAARRWCGGVRGGVLDRSSTRPTNQAPATIDISTSGTVWCVREPGDGSARSKYTIVRTTVRIRGVRGRGTHLMVSWAPAPLHGAWPRGAPCLLGFACAARRAWCRRRGACCVRPSQSPHLREGEASEPPAPFIG